MKAQSDTIPESFVKSNGKTQVNYNIQSIVKIDEKGTRTIYIYDYVEIDGEVTKNKFIDALDKKKQNQEIWDPTNEYNILYPK